MQVAQNQRNLLYSLHKLIKSLKKLKKSIDNQIYKVYYIGGMKARKSSNKKEGIYYEY